MEAIILAAGEGRRLLPLTLSRPKPMIDVLGRPLLHHIIESIPNEITELIIVIGYKGEQIRSYFGEQFEGRTVTYVYQEKPSGTARALELCRPHLSPGERFLFLFADDLHSRSAIQNLLKHPMGMLVREHSDPGRFGVVQTDARGRVLEFEEKPKAPKSNLVSPGVFVLDTRIFSYTPTRHESGEYFLTSQVAQFIKDHEMVVEKTDFWHPIGYPDDVTAAEEILLKVSGATAPANPTRVIILAGGKGTRMPEAEKRLPKSLVHVGGKVILQHQIDRLYSQGFHTICLALGDRADQIIQWLNENKLHKIEYVVEPNPLGTGGAIKYAMEHEVDACIVINGDVLSDFNFRSLLRASGNGAYSVIAGMELADASGFGILQCDETKHICVFNEKIKENEPGLVNAGAYVIRPDDIREMPAVFSIEYDLFPRLAKEGKLVIHEHHGNYWFDCGTEERLRRVREYFANS